MLEDDRTLSFYNIMHESTLVLTLSNKMKILVEVNSSEILELSVYETVTIANVKTFVQGETKIPTW